MRGLKPELNKKIKDALAGKFPQAGLVITEDRGIVVVQAKIPVLIDLMKYLKSDPACSFNVLIDLTSVDYLNKKPAAERFEVVYLLWSTSTMQRLRVKVAVAEGGAVPSLVSIWKGANWPEREVFDLMGVEFSGHPNMDRILMPENFRGHPLRKDFPLEGIGEDYLIESLLLPEEKKA